MLNIVLFGPPGAGKGTQAAKLQAKYGIRHISTGEIIRSEISQGTPLGREAAGYIEQGHLAPDALIIDMMIEYIHANKDSKGILFDGFPRTIAQAEALDDILGTIGETVDIMTSLEVPDRDLVMRISLRAQDSGRVDDMNLNVIENRIAVYKKQTAVVADYYDSQNKYCPVDGTGSIDDVFQSLCEKIDAVID